MKALLHLNEKKYISFYEIDNDSLEAIELPNDFLEEFKSSCYQYINNEFIFDSIMYQNIKNHIRKEELQKELCDEDYKVIKCYEYFLVGKNIPYDINEIHISRELKRKEIDNIERLLNEN